MSDNSIGGLFLIFIGLIFLLINLGVVPRSIWYELVKFWPVLLILAGLEYLLGESKIAKIGTFCLALIAFCAITLYLIPSSASLIPGLSSLPDIMFNPL